MYVETKLRVVAGNYLSYEMTFGEARDLIRKPFHQNKPAACQVYFF